ncbi:LamG domain-containing protein [bacterium]|nr:LamG domain-containing protein [bacterium]
MPNLIKSGTTATAGTIRRYNFFLGVDTTVQYTQEEISQFYFTIVPPANGYAVYEQKVVQGPSIRIAQNDTDFITISQQYSQNKNISSATEGLSYFNGVPQYMVTNLDYPYISTSGLTVLLDAGFTPSYCRTGANWNDLSGNDNSAILFNSPAFSLNSGGVFLMNGSSNFASGSIPSMSTFTFGAWVNITSVVGNAGIISPSVGGFGLQIGSTSQSFQFFNASADGNTIIPNTWYYVVGTQDSTTQRLYINGSLVSSATSTTTVKILHGYSYSNNNPNSNSYNDANTVNHS